MYTHHPYRDLLGLKGQVVTVGGSAAILCANPAGARKCFCSQLTSPRFITAARGIPGPSPVARCK